MFAFLGGSQVNNFLLFSHIIFCSAEDTTGRQSFRLPIRRMGLPTVGIESVPCLPRGRKHGGRQLNSETPLLPFTSCVTLGKSLHLSESQFALTLTVSKSSPEKKLQIRQERMSKHKSKGPKSHIHELQIRQEGTDRKTNAGGIRVISEKTMCQN